MFWTRIATFILKNRIFFVVGILLFTGVMSYFATKVELEYSMQKLVPSDDADVVFYEEFKKKFGHDGNKLVAAISTPELFDLAFFTKFRTTADSIAKIDGVKNILSPVTLYNLYLDTNIDLLQMQALVPSIPKKQSELDSIKKKFFSLKFYEGLIYNPQKKVSLVIITLNDSILDSKGRIKLLEEVTGKLNHFGLATNREIHTSGLPFIRYRNATTVKDEILMFTVLAFIVTAILILILFKSIKTLLISLLFIAIGEVTMLGITALLGFKLNLLSGTLPPLLVVVGVQNTIYLINQYHDQFRKLRNKAKSLTRIISHVGVATFLINFTTAVGFGTFYFTNVSILEQFGLVAFITINIIFFINIIGIPIIYSYLPKPSLKQTAHLDNNTFNGFLNWVEKIVFKHKRRVFYWFFLLSVISSVFLVRLRPLAFIVDDIPHDSKIYKDLEYIQTNFHGAMPYEIIVTSYEEGDVLSVDMLSKGRRLQRALKEFEELSKPMSIVEVVSAANQAANDDNPLYYRIPKATDFGELVLKFPQGGSKQNNALIRGLMDSTFTEMRISYQMKDVGSKSMDSINTAVTKIAKDIFPAQEYNVQITGTSTIFLKGNSYLYKSLVQSTFWSLLIISLTMTFLFPSWKMILIAIIPNIIPLLITAGTMGYFQISLKPSTILIFSIAFGITVDATIHFVSVFRRELIKKRKNVRESLQITIHEVGLSLIYSSLAVCAGFFIFVFSGFQGTQALGWLTGLTILGGAATNLFLLPALILAFEKFINPKFELKESLLTMDDDQPEELA